MQETRVQSLGREDPTCRGATKPVHHNYWACTLEPASHNYWAWVPQLLKPMRLEPLLHNKRSLRNEKPAHHNEDPMQPKKKREREQNIWTRDPWGQLLVIRPSGGEYGYIGFCNTIWVYNIFVIFNIVMFYYVDVNYAYYICLLISVFLFRSPLHLSPMCAVPWEIDFYGPHQWDSLLYSIPLDSANGKNRLKKLESKAGESTQGFYFLGSLPFGSLYIDFIPFLNATALLGSPLHTNSLSKFHWPLPSLVSSGWRDNGSCRLLVLETWLCFVGFAWSSHTFVNSPLICSP